MVERLEEMRKGKRERIEKGSRERIEREREKRKRRRRRSITTCLCLLFSFLKAPRYSKDMSSRLDSAVKRCSSEVLVYSRAAW